MYNIDYAGLPSRIKTIRNNNKLTQQQFGDSISVSRSFVCRIESGKEKPSESILKLIALQYNVSTDWLNYGEGTISPNENSYDLFDRNSKDQIHIGTQKNILQLVDIINRYNMTPIDNNISALIGDLESFLNYYYETDKNIGVLVFEKIVTPMLVLIEKFSDINPNTSEDEIDKKSYSCMLELTDGLKELRKLRRELSDAK